MEGGRERVLRASLADLQGSGGPEGRGRGCSDHRLPASSSTSLRSDPSESCTTGVERKCEPPMTCLRPGGGGQRQGAEEWWER